MEAQIPGERQPSGCPKSWGSGGEGTASHIASRVTHIFELDGYVSLNRQTNDLCPIIKIQSFQSLFKMP
jgi:hypothetical protein